MPPDFAVTVLQGRSRGGSHWATAPPPSSEICVLGCRLLEYYEGQQKFFQSTGEKIDASGDSCE